MACTHLGHDVLVQVGEFRGARRVLCHARDLVPAASRQHHCELVDQSLAQDGRLRREAGPGAGGAGAAAVARRDHVHLPLLDLRHGAAGHADAGLREARREDRRLRLTLVLHRRHGRRAHLGVRRLLRPRDTHHG